MRVDGTLLGTAPLRTSLVTIGITLSLLFTLIKPECSAHLSFIPRLVFWLVHIGLGLVAIVLAGYCLRMLAPDTAPALLSPKIAGLVLTGLLGTLFVAPVYTLLDSWFGQPVEEPWVASLQAMGLWQAVMAEWLECAPQFMAAWLAVNLPFLFAKPELLKTFDPAPAPQLQEDPEELRREALRQDLLAKLPKVLGRDLVAISSDLHYLNVHTTEGRALVLGALRTYADAFGEQGMLVHRSNWVMKAHIRKVHIAGDTAYCVMSTGLQVPISRSRRKLVKDTFGQAHLRPPTANVIAFKR